MPAKNTANSFGFVTRSFHWLTALLILTAIPLGLIANRMGTDPASIAAKVQLFSLHKTMGVAAFLIGSARILWALTQTHPAPLHPERRLETGLADVVHWLLYLSLVIVPLSGWVTHAAVDGFAPILWPFGQDLPMVPKSETLGQIAGALHWVFTKVLAVSILLHIAGALKHHLIDKDATLARMTRGVAAPATPVAMAHRYGPLAVALVVYGAGTFAALSLVPAASQTVQATETAGNWQVVEGQLGLSVRQMGAAVEGNFGQWSAEITYDETISSGKAGAVRVTIDLASLALGSVSDQAKGAEFLAVVTHPTAIFVADIMATPTGPEAQGQLDLHGVTKSLTLPFALTITGEHAQMTGAVALDRRDFGIGAGYGDESTVGYGVDIAVTLTAKRP